MGKGFVVALVCVLTFSAIGEEPLPLVLAKAAFPDVTTEVEPVHETAPVTMADAARQNDFAAFNALYAARPNPAFADLHELWTYSQTDRFGAFYGEELHAKFASRYPGYAAYIEEYRLVDSHGVAFWPSAETRSFLLERAVSDQRPAIRRTEAPPRIARVATAPKHATPKRTTPKPAPAPVIAAAPQPAPVAAPIADRQSPIAAQPIAQAPQTNDNSATGRGIFLMILGLIGVGVLTLMLRTPPAEEEHEEQAPREVIPTLKLTSLPPPTEPQQQQPRKTGSHG